jgi:hypothetical protein
MENKETLEEAAKKYVDSFEYGIAHPKRVCKNAFINGAKWQQEHEQKVGHRVQAERMYSEEDMISFATFYDTHQGAEYWGKDLFKVWFEQYKKK